MIDPESGFEGFSRNVTITSKRITEPKIERANINSKICALYVANCSSVYIWNLSYFGLMKSSGRKNPNKLPKRLAVVPIIVDIVLYRLRNQLPVTLAGALYTNG